MKLALAFLIASTMAAFAQQSVPPGAYAQAALQANSLISQLGQAAEQMQRELTADQQQISDLKKQISDLKTTAVPKAP